VLNIGLMQRCAVYEHLCVVTFHYISANSDDTLNEKNPFMGNNDKVTT